MDLRAGRFDGQMTDDAAQFSSSIEFDKRIFKSDIQQMHWLSNKYVSYVITTKF